MVSISETFHRWVNVSTFLIIVSQIYKHRRPVGLGFLVLLAVLTIDLTQRERHAFAVLSFVGQKTLNKGTEPKFPPLAQGCNSDHGQISVLDASLACVNFPSHLLSTTQVVLKTGVAEAAKTRALLDTVALCILNILIVSDAEEVIQGHDVVDVLADLPASYADDNPDWAAYLHQKEALATGKPISKSRDGWYLDRFKFLPMIEKAYERAPDAHWFIFIESDIYFFWDTAFRLLGLLDHNEYHYLGLPVPASAGLLFVYGGGGIVLSGRLVRDLLQGGTLKISEKYEQLVKDDCCGDAVLTYVLWREMGIRMEALAPTFSGEDPAWLKVRKDNWCTPLLGLHRISPDKARDLWEWERCRPLTEQPITYSSFLDFMLPADGSAGPLMNWDVGAGDLLPETSPGHRSAHACESACRYNDTCLQYRYSTKDRECTVADWVTRGVPSPDYISGRSLESLQMLGYSVGANPGSFCEQPQWLMPKIMYPESYTGTARI